MSFIPYQVDYSVKNTAKTLGFSKKKVTFSFGFANAQALEEGLTGAACRGSEHQVTFIWSLKTGKRQLFLDGREMHFSESRQNGWVSDREWQHVFRLKDPGSQTAAPLKAHFISQTINRDIPNSRPFDLRIGGLSYFRFNQIFELGTSRMRVRGLMDGSSSGRGGGGGDDPYLSPEERRQIAQAKVESLRDMEQQSNRNRAPAPSAGSASMNRDEGALISFDEDPTPTSHSAPPMAGSSTPQAPQLAYYASSITLDTAIDDTKPPAPLASSSSSYGANPYAPQQQQQQPPSSYYGYSTNPYALQQPQQPQQPSYGAPAAAPAASSNAMMPYQPPTGQTSPSPYAINAQQQQPAPYSASTTPSYTSQPSYNNTSMMQQQQQPPSFASTTAPAPPQAQPSPSGYSTSGFSTYSYGSAPSFAQPPAPQQQQQQYPPQQQQQYAPQQQQQQYQQYPPPQQQQQQQPPSYY